MLVWVNVVHKQNMLEEGPYNLMVPVDGAETVYSHQLMMVRRLEGLGRSAGDIGLQYMHHPSTR